MLMTEMRTLFHAAIADLRAYAPPVHLPNVETARSTAEVHFDTMALLVFLSQANEAIMANSLRNGYGQSIEEGDSYA